MTIYQAKSTSRKLLILHHTAVSRETQPAQFYAVNRYHKEKWNMKSTLGYYTGYTHFMGTNGVITQTRSLEEEGIHTRGKNKVGHIGLGIAGNFSVELPNKKQVDSLIKFIKDNPEYRVAMHREFCNTTCPGDLITREYLENVIFEKEVKLSKNDIEKQELIIKYQSLLDTLREILMNLLNRI